MKPSVSTDGGSMPGEYRRPSSKLPNWQEGIDSEIFETLDAEGPYLSPKYESLNYDVCESQIFLEHERQLDHNFQVRSTLLRWILMGIVGVSTAVVGALAHMFIHKAMEIKFSLIKSHVQTCLTQGCMWIPLAIWIIFNTSFAVTASLLTTYIEPATSGSGIPPVKCYLNGIKMPGFVRKRTLFIKVFGVVCSVCGGLAVGKEGPMIHTGAIVASGIAQGLGFRRGFLKKYMDSLRDDKNRREFVAGGGAAGVASAFGTPLGGVLFSIEEGISWWNPTLVWQIFLCAMIAALSLHNILAFFYGVPGLLSYQELLIFGTFNEELSYHALEVPIFLLMGVFGGLLGAAHNHINVSLNIWRKKHIKERWKKVVEVAAVATASAVVGFGLSYFVDICDPEVTPVSHDSPHYGRHDHQPAAMVTSSMATPFLSNASSSFLLTPHLDLHDVFASSSPLNKPNESLLDSGVEATQHWGTTSHHGSLHAQMFCPNGSYNTIAAMWFQGAEANVKWLFHKTGEDSLSVLGIFLVAYILLATWTYGLSIPSGLFIPSLLTGAIWGRFVGVIISRIARNIPGYEKAFFPGKYSLIGAAAHLGGVVRMTLSLTLILVEATSNVKFGLPLMLTLIMAKLVGDHFNKGIYDMHIELDGVPVLTWSPPPLLHCIKARHVMSCPVVTLPPVIKASELIAVLTSCSHHGFPIVVPGSDDLSAGKYGNFQGQITWSQLLVLLRSRAFCETMPAGSHLPLSIFKDAYPNYGAVQDIPLSSKELDYSIDLRPYMNPAPFTVNLEESFPRAYYLFRGLGLRHLVVVDASQVVGMITRKDLARVRPRRALRRSRSSSETGAVKKRSASSTDRFSMNSSEVNPLAANSSA